MADVVKEELVCASVAEVWAVWDGFADIANWHPGLKKSALLDGSIPTGLGARRRCDFSDGKHHILEEIVGYEEGQQMVVHIYDGNIPVQSSKVTFSFKPEGPNKTRVKAEVDFKMKGGILGSAVKPLAKRQLGADIAKLLKANRAFVEQGAI